MKKIKLYLFIGFFYLLRIIPLIFCLIGVVGASMITAIDLLQRIVGNMIGVYYQRTLKKWLYL